MKDVVASIKKKRASDPVPECAALNPTRLRFLDASGDTIATVENTCAGYASIEFEDGRAGYMVKVDLQAVETARAAPFAVGDAVWGISKIELVKGRGASAEKRMVTGGRMQPILNGFDLDAVPDPQMIRPACLPAYSVTLKRGGDAVAYSSFLCSLGAPAASVGARFSAVEPGGDEVASGGILIDPRPVVHAFASN